MIDLPPLQEPFFHPGNDPPRDLEADPAGGMGVFQLHHHPQTSPFQVNGTLTGMLLFGSWKWGQTEDEWLSKTVIFTMILLEKEPWIMNLYESNGLKKPIDYLGGGFKYFLFSPPNNWGNLPMFTSIFFKGVGSTTFTAPTSRIFRLKTPLARNVASMMMMMAAGVVSWSFPSGTLKSFECPQPFETPLQLSFIHSFLHSFIPSRFSSCFWGHQLPAKRQEMLLRTGPYLWRFDADAAKHPPIQLVKVIHLNHASNTHPSYLQPTLQIMKGSRVVVVKEKHEAAKGSVTIVRLKRTLFDSFSLEENWKERNGPMNDDCGCWQKRWSRSGDCGWLVD